MHVYTDIEVQEFSPKFSSLVKDMVASHTKGDFTDKNCEPSEWAQTTASLKTMSNMKDEKKYCLTGTVYDLWNNIFYIPDTYKGKFSTIGQFKTTLWHLPRTKKAIAPQGNAITIDPLKTPKGSSAPVSNASGIAHALRGNKAALALFEAAVEGRETWDLKEFLSALAQIKKCVQATHKGTMGDIIEITPGQYDAWAKGFSDTEEEVGPYLLQKYAQQNGVRMFISGDNFKLRYSGMELECVDAYEVRGDPSKFAKGLTNKRKPLVYSSISRQAYVMQAIFHRFYSVENGPGSSLQAGVYVSKKMTDARLNDLPSLIQDEDELNPGPFRKALMEVAVEFNKAGVEYCDHDVAIEKIARMCEKHLQAVDMDNYMIDALTSMTSAMTMFDSAFDAAAKADNIKDKATIIRSTTKCSKIQDAVQLLASERDHRNVSPAMQYAYKQMGSIGGNSSIPACDTILKGARIKSFLDNEMGFEPETVGKMAMYGVAYGHMVPTLQYDSIEMSLYDKKPEPRCKYSVAEANIFSIDADWSKVEKGIIIDDTMTESLPSQKEQKALEITGVKIDVTKSGDWNKLQKFLRMPPGITIISKMSFKNVEQTTWMEMLFPDDEKMRKWKHVGITKFGKLHNNEVFLTLSNAPGAPPTSRTQFRIQISSLITAIGISNTILQAFANNATPNGIAPKSLISTTWLKLIESLPDYWAWYRDAYEADLSVGSEIVSQDGQVDDYADVKEDVKSIWGDKKERKSKNKPQQKLPIPAPTN